MTTVNDAIKYLNKEHGARTVYTLDADIDLNHPRIPTGVIAVDNILGGGLPKGRIVDIYGNPGAGKTSLMLYFLAQAQKHGKCVFVDLENAFDPAMAEASGIDLSELIVSQPDSAETVFEIIEHFALAKDCAAIVIDSFAGMVPEAELAGDIGDSHVGLIGRLTSQFLRVLTKRMPKEDSQCILVFINQMRATIAPFGPTQLATGGKAIKFYASTRMEITRVEGLKKGDDVVGQKVQVKTDKNKLAAPFQKAYFDIYYDRGISNESAMIDEAVSRGVWDKTKQGHYSDNRTGVKIGHGRNQVLTYLEENPEYASEIRELVLP